jgi:hypothetical protein
MAARSGNYELKISGRTLASASVVLVILLSHVRLGFELLLFLFSSSYPLLPRHILEHVNQRIFRRRRPSERAKKRK